MVGLIEIKATQPSWGLGLAELGKIKIILKIDGVITIFPSETNFI